MKVLALVLFVVAAAQGRSTLVESRQLAALGENPWVVHIRLAIGTSGLLNSCVGSLIDDGWVLTSASCVNDSRFIWLRYGVVEVIRPELVTEASNVVTHPQANLAAIRINRVIESSDNIAPIALAGANDENPESGKLCAFGAEKNGAPGESLKCSNVGLLAEDETLVSGDAANITVFDLGAPLVADGKLVGVLVGIPRDDKDAARFLKVSNYIDWILSETAVEELNQVEPSRVIVVDHA